MEDLLILQYPSMANRIKKARDLGFSDEEIERELKSRVERARAQGFSELEINQALGITEQTRTLLQEAKRRNALESISEAYDLTIPRAQKAVEHRVHPALLTDEEIARRIEAEDRQIKVGPMHERPSVETLRTHSAFWRKVNDPAVGATNRAVGGLAAGFTMAAGGFSRSVEWLTGWEAARKFADKLESAAGSLTSEITEGAAPNLWDAFWQGSGSLAFYLLPGMVAAKTVLGAAGGAYALGMSEKAAVSLAKWLGASTQQVIEGFSEAGPVYKRVLDETGDEGAASLAAAKTFWTNLPLGILTNRLGFFGDSEIVRKAMGKVLPDRAVHLIADAVARGVPEAVQEVGQGLISERYGGRVKWTDLDLKDAIVNEGIPGFLVAAITGATFEAGRSLASPAEVTEDSRIRYRAQAAKVYNRVKEQLVNAGMDEQQAGVNAALWSARAYTVGVMTNTDPESWYDRQKLRVQKDVAPGTTPDAVYYQYAGTNARVMPGGLEEAERMRKNGASNEEIRRETGWFFGMDGEPRFEIDDSAAKFAAPLVGQHKLAAVLDFPALFKAYPSLSDINVELDPTLPDGTGEYYGATDTIRIAPSSKGMEHQLGILLHEIQHAIQSREPLFADGGNLRVALGAQWKMTRWGNYMVAQRALDELESAMVRGADRVALEDKDGNIVGVFGQDQIRSLADQLRTQLKAESVYETYRRISGEIEAWDVYNRHGLSAEERRETPPDLRRDAIIVRNGKVIRFGAHSAMPPISLDEKGEPVPNTQVAKAFWQSARKTSQGEPVDKLSKVLEKADWHIFTAANPMGKVLSAAENAERNAALTRDILGIATKAEKNNRIAKSWDLVKETEAQEKLRREQGYTQIVLVDPREFREMWEAQHNDTLAYAEGRLERLMTQKAFDGYPKVSRNISDPNRVEILDGRHRIVAAEKRGLLIPVAMDPDYPIPKQLIKGTKKPETRGKITVMEARGVFGGEPEPSLFVTGLTTAEAIDLAKKWGQAAITTPTGIYWVNDVVDENGLLQNYEGEFAPFTKGFPVIGTDLSDNYTEIDIDGTPVRFSYPADFENTFWMPKGGVAPGISPRITAYLTPAERVKIRERTATSILHWLKKLPDPNEMASVAWAGRAKRGWYERSARAIAEAFGPDAPRFAALLAALSPQCSVEDNLSNTLRTWTNWIKAGRPTDTDAIVEIMGRSVQGDKGKQSILPAWINNAIRALTARTNEELAIAFDADTTVPGLGEVIEAWRRAGKTDHATVPVPDGWFIHGRSDGLHPATTGYPVELLRNWVYAGWDGPGTYAVRPGPNATVLDLSSTHTQDMDTIVAEALRQYREGDGRFDLIAKWIAESTWREITEADIEDAVRASFAPKDIGLSAEAYDNEDWVQWFERSIGADFVITPDGGVALHPEYAEIYDLWEVSQAAKTAANGDIVLSGPKVDSFRQNLLGVTIEVTNDTWMANYAGILQKYLSGHINKAGTDPGKGSAYLAMNILTRRAAEILTERTGDRWTPSEVQETVWSWARSLYYAAQQKKVNGKSMPLVDFLKSGGLTAEHIASTPDFEILFITGVYEDILREAGYGEEVERIRQLAKADHEGPGGDGTGGSPAWSPDSGIDRATYERHLQEAAERLSSEQVGKNIAEEEAPTTFYQGSDAPRGRLEVTVDGERIISLFQNADESTFMHETAHVFLLDFEELAARDDAPEQVKKDWETLKKWLGVEHGQTLDVTHHEKFARGFEAWLMEGEAPSPRLARVFEWFRKWLTSIYHSVAQLDVVLSDDVRGIYDRMFALEDEIESRTFYQDKVVPFNDLPPDPGNAEETQAIMAMEGPANRAADGDEEALFDPAWFNEGSPEAAAEVDDFLAATEAIAMKTEAWKGWQNLVRAIRNMGGISYDQVANILGKDMADRIRETAGWLYRRAGLAMDDMAQRLADLGFDIPDAQALFNRLVERPEPPRPLPPVLEVNQDNIPWLIDRLGTAQARRYLKRRIAAIDATLKELRAEHEKISNEGTDEAMAQMLKEEMWRLYAERTLAAETDGELAKASPKAPSGAPVRWGDMARRAKGQAFKWVQVRVKDAIAQVTGQTSVGELVSEKEALREAMRLAQRYSRIAAQIARKTGYRAGYIEARQRVLEVKRRQAARAAERAEVRAMVKDLDTATRGGISWGAREKIADILEKYDTKRRGITKPVRELAKAEGMDPRQYQARIDAELRQFLADNPEAADDFTPDDLARLTRRSVYEMTMDELRKLHAEVMALREAGKAELKEKQQAYREKIDNTVKTLIKSLGGPKGPTEQKMVPGQRKRGVIEHMKAWSLTPSRILDWLDKYGDFKGTWHNYMMRRADAAEDAFLKAKFSRHDAMMAKMKELGISENDLAAVRYSTVDPETGERVDFTLDAILEVYAGWLNEKKRDALRYGNGIDEAMKAEMEKLLKPQEIELVQAVLADYENRRQALKDAMVNTYDVGFLDEPFYTPMYRDSWRESGELVESGLEAVKNEFLRVNGLRRFYARHGFSHTRQTISPEHQTPLQIGLFGNWLKTVDIQEHFIAYASMVKEFQDVLKDPVLKRTLTATHGKEVYDALEHFVNRLAVPDFYKGFAATDVMARFIRSNAAVAYLAYNLGTILKQPTALAYYLRDAGPTHLLLSACEFAMAPRETIRKVWNLDPQVKDQAIERTLEELRRTRDPKYKRLKHAIGRAGFKPILWFDMVTRVIGWNAVYKAELAKGTNPEDARYRAQRVTLNTQQAANPKELPRYMAQSEFLNLLTIFQNQANKVWNITTHDLWGDLKQGRIGGAVGTAMGLLTATFLLSLMSKGEPPDDPDELANYLTEDIVGSVPLIGKGIISAWHGFGGGSAIDSAAQDIGRGLKGLAEFEFGGDEILALYEAYAILLGGVPVTAVKRLLRALDEGRPGALLGWRKKKRKKDVMVYF